MINSFFLSLHFVFPGRVPFDPNFEKFRFNLVQSRIGNRKFPEIRFENFGQPHESCPFSPEIGKFWKFPVPFVVSTPYETAPVPLVQNFCLDQSDIKDSSESALHWICHSSSLFCIIPSLHNPPRKKFASFSHKKVFESVRKISRKSLPKMIVNTC